ncbi:hypothetical protein M9979_16520 [Sphingomonas sp. RP10(2022)]|uniref:Lipoprotein n=1 Tax=Sphingomonas liriopis TaxID=2949094 RepID=A0A9X2HZI4_9SPHN|nr:hypothetical protein [Sphingomonas liriopis]MCP3736473.1 hypothetical protein [Sphingomonas liriopis]
MAVKADLKFTTSVAAALLASGCGGTKEADGWTAQRDTAICTDAGGKRVADDQCRQQQAHGGVHAGSNAFLWYFLARNAVIPPYGEAVRGGAYARTPGRSYFRAPGTTRVTRAGAISRGGFGASAHRFGGARS